MIVLEHQSVSRKIHKKDTFMQVETIINHTMNLNNLFMNNTMIIHANQQKGEYYE